jgi:PKD repeat protein
LTVNFEDQSPGDITDWRWDFGEGGESDQQNPSHTYTKPGVFDVSLTISTPFGDYTETKEEYIRTCVMNDPDNGRWGEKDWCEAGDNGKWCEDVSYAGISDASYAPGPLCPAAEYRGYITPGTDKADVYFVELIDPGAITINLVVPDAGVDYDLYLYQDSWTPYGDYLAKSVNGGAADEQITYNGGAGRYFIEVWAYSGYSSGAPYILTVDYD